MEQRSEKNRTGSEEEWQQGGGGKGGKGMTVEEAGQKGGQKVKKWVEEGKEKEGERGESWERDEE